MRRIVAAVLLIALFGQSSGSALAAGRNGVESPTFDLASAIAPMYDAVLGSQIYEAFTGREDRYAATHHAPPMVRHEQPTRWEAPKFPHKFEPQFRMGIRQHVAMPPLTALHILRRDPLSMPRGAARPGPIRFGGHGRSLDIRSLPAISRPRAENVTMAPMATTTAPNNGTTGINHWWDYEVRSIPGIGQAMVNVGTGNLVVASTDVDVPEVGIDLAFRRVYNVQSQQDVNNDDNSGKALYGNRWTNTFNVDMVYDSTAQTITIYDIDGTQCVYSPTSDTTDYPTGWKPCAGEHAVLTPTDTSDCTYAWMKQSGTTYWFHADNNGGGSCSIALAKKGHLQEILARNTNNNITFAYSFASGGNGAEYVTEIDANHSDGESLILRFAAFGPNGCTPGVTAGCWNELASIQRPDGQRVQYSYDSSGNLIEVDKPGNDAATTKANSSILSANGVNAGHLPETYLYASGTSNLQWAMGPRATIAIWNNASAPTDGSDLGFTYDPLLRVTNWHAWGKINFAPGVPGDPDYPHLLEPGLTSGWAQWFVAYFYYAATDLRWGLA